MHRIDTAGATQDNRFTDGNPQQGIPATVVDDDILNALQEELVYCVLQGGLQLQKGNNTQVWTALLTKFATIAALAAHINDAAAHSAEVVNNASTTVKGIVELATNGETATGTSTSLVPSVSAMAYHQGVAKSWINFDGTGTIAARDSYNITGITDNGVGDYTVTINADHANADYVPLITTGPALTGSPNSSLQYVPNLYAMSAGAYSFQCSDPSNNTKYDPEVVVCVTFGDR